jgi:hypothetical protein
MRLNTIEIGASSRVKNAAIYGAIEVILLDWCVPTWWSGHRRIGMFTYLHPRTMAPVYIQLSADRIRVGQVIREHRANIFDISSYIRSERECIAPPGHTIWHWQLARGRRGDVIFFLAASFVLETIRQAGAAVR